jgi:hypothetical protein
LPRKPSRESDKGISKEESLGRCSKATEESLGSDAPVSLLPREGPGADPDGSPTTRTITLDELSESEELSEVEIQGIARLTAAFGAELILEEVPPAPLRPCYSCHGTLFWCSIYKATIHPPAAPGLVERWIEADPPEQSDPDKTWFGLGELSDEERRRRVEFLKKFAHDLNESEE